MNLEQLSAELEQLVERVAGSVVSVQGGGNAISGIVIKPEHVLSIHHVLERNADVSVVSADGSFKGEVVGRDRRSDLALVRVPGLQAPALQSHTSASVGALNLVVARSVRGNLEVSQGVVAFNSGVLEMGRGRFRLEGLVRSTAQTFSGISGAPMVNVKGELIGVVNGSLMRGSSLALNAATVAQAIAELEKGGGLKRGFLGVGVQPVRLEAGGALLVNSVESDGPAARGGVLIGDVLVKLNGHTLGRMEDLMMALSQSVDQTVSLELQRGGVAQTLQVTVTERVRRAR
jgi:S1-C subfamily serine protease